MSTMTALKDTALPEAPFPYTLADLQGRVSIATGLLELHDNRYETAAHAFLGVQVRPGQLWSTVLSAQDVALYGALLAMASMSRAHLKELVLGSAAFRPYLQTVPDLADMVRDFCETRYESCLRKLARLEPRLLLDLHFERHVPAVCRAIRRRAMVQYAQPYAMIRLSVMAGVFGTHVDKVLVEVEQAISQGLMPFRIDVVNQVEWCFFCWSLNTWL